MTFPLNQRRKRQRAIFALLTFPGAGRRACFARTKALGPLFAAIRNLQNGLLPWAAPDMHEFAGRIKGRTSTRYIFTLSKQRVVSFKQRVASPFSSFSAGPRASFSSFRPAGVYFGPSSRSGLQVDRARAERKYPPRFWASAAILQRYASLVLFLTNKY